MQSSSKRGVLAGLLPGLGIAVFASSAVAGLSSTPGVTINDTTRYAEGSLVGARSSANAVEYIGVTSDNSGVTFWAKDAAGTYRTCYAPSPSTDFRVRVSGITEQSWIKFGWGQFTSYCEGNITIVTSSQYTSP